MKYLVHTITAEEGGEITSILVRGSKRELLHDLVEAEVDMRFVSEALESVQDVEPGILNLSSEWFSPKVCYTYTVTEVIPQPIPPAEQLLAMAAEENSALEEEVEVWRRRAFEAQAKARHFRKLAAGK